MDSSDKDGGTTPSPVGVPLDLVGETLLLGAVVLAPWVYGSVEDSVRFALCSIVLVASALSLWSNLGQGRLPRGAVVALAFPGFASLQILLGQSVAPWLTVEASGVGFAMAMAWATVDARVGSTATNAARRLAIALVAVCASEAAFAAFQWSTDQRVLFGRKSELLTMPFGSYVNHNNFAGLLTLGVPLAVAMAIGDIRRSGKLTPQGLGLLGLATGLIISVLASGSRGGSVALVFGLVALASMPRLLMRARIRSQSWVFVMLVGGGVLGLSILAIPTITRTRFSKALDRSGSVGYRTDIAMASLRAFGARPCLGSGLGAFSDAATPFKIGHGDVRSERAEADLIEFAVEGGLVLISGLLLFARFAWKSSHLGAIQDRSRSGKWLRAGAVASCFTMMAHSLFDFGFRIPANALAFSVILGIATASPDLPLPRSLRISRAFLAILILVAATGIYRSLGAAGERAALARKNPESRLAALQSLVDMHPYLEQARRQRGLAWMALAYSRGQYDPIRLSRAQSDLEAVVATRPQWGEALADLGWVKYFEGKPSEAKAMMAQATRFDPTHVGVGIASAQLMAWSGDIPGALNQISRLRASNPQWSRASARDLAASWTQDASVLRSIP